MTCLISCLLLLYSVRKHHSDWVSVRENWFYSHDFIYIYRYTHTYMLFLFLSILLSTFLYGEQQMKAAFNEYFIKRKPRWKILYQGPKCNHINKPISYHTDNTAIVSYIHCPRLTVSFKWDPFSLRHFAYLNMKWINYLNYTNIQQLKSEESFLDG